VLPGLGNAREMVKWAYSNDKGAVSSIMLVDDQYIVAVLAGVGEIGLKDIEEVRSEVEFKIRQEKKGQKLIEKYKDALAAGAIEEIAKMAEKELGTLTEINFENPYSTEIGRDLIVAGTCFGTPEGKVSKPVIGNKGVYVVKPEFHVDAPQVSDYNEYKNKVANNLKSRTEYAIITALREMAEIRDYRYKY
jgi:peptidyl-prolyl cis-trans isomerase D